MYFYMGFAITPDLFSTLSLLFIFSASVMLFIYLNLDLGVHYQFSLSKPRLGLSVMQDQILLFNTSTLLFFTWVYILYSNHQCAEKFIMI